MGFGYNPAVFNYNGPDGDFSLFYRFFSFLQR
jgi:hypothetical protein